jgi:DNA modification methylase
LGRAFIGIERNKKYFDIACQRIERACSEYQDQFPEVREMIETKELFETA